MSGISFINTKHKDSQCYSVNQQSLKTTQNSLSSDACSISSASIFKFSNFCLISGSTSVVFIIKVFALMGLRVGGPLQIFGKFFVRFVN